MLTFSQRNLAADSRSMISAPYSGCLVEGCSSSSTILFSLPSSCSSAVMTRVRPQKPGNSCSQAASGSGEAVWFRSSRFLVEPTTSVDLSVGRTLCDRATPGSPTPEAFEAFSLAPPACCRTGGLCATSRFEPASAVGRTAPEWKHPTKHADTTTRTETRFDPRSISASPLRSQIVVDLRR